MITEVGRSVGQTDGRAKCRLCFCDEEGNDDAFRLQNTASISRFIWHEEMEEEVQHSVGAMIRGFATKNNPHGTKNERGEGLNRLSHSLREIFSTVMATKIDIYDEWDAD